MTWAQSLGRAVKSVLVGGERVATVNGPIIPDRQGVRGGVGAVTDDRALRHSAVWACLRLRADIVSTLPVDNFRDVTIDGSKIAVEMPKPPILVTPGGQDWPWEDWSYASQNDVDACGNTVGIITERTGQNLPARVDLQARSDVTIFQNRNDDRAKYRIAGKVYTRDQVWHERQFPVSGRPYGLSPILYAAASISEYLSAQQMGLDWFAGSGVPKARLKNTERKVDAREAAQVKERWHASIGNGDIFVHGNTWEYNLMQAEAAGSEWLDARRFGLADVCRFFGCPADLIEAAISSPGTLTYQSISQRNLQFLILQLGPALVRRERAWSRGLLPQPRYVKVNTAALVRLDPKAQGDLLDAAVKGRRMTVTEARAKMDLPPLTPEQEAEFNRLFGPPKGAEPLGKTLARGPDLAELVTFLRSVYDPGLAPVSPGMGPLWLPDGVAANVD